MSVQLSFLGLIESPIVMRISSRLSYRFRWIPALASLLLIVLGATLGQWQTRRAIEKEVIAAAMLQRAKLPPLTSLPVAASPHVSSDVVFRRVKLSGTFISSWALYLDNRPLHGVAGFYVLMPFKPSDSDKAILIARGWQARDSQDRTRLPQLFTPGGEVEIEGIMRTGLDRVMQLGSAEPLRPGAIVQNLDVVTFSKQSGMLLADGVLEQTSMLADGLQRDWPLSSAGSDRHRGYAFQWYGLALMAFLFFVITGFRREKNG